MELRARLKAAPGSLFHWLGSFVFPDSCLRCGAGAGRFPICPACREEALSAPRPAPAPPPGLSSLQAGLALTEPVRALIHGIKYQGQRGNAKALVELALAHGLPPDLPADAVLVPVPLHAARRRERGYNQSLLLAKAWSSRTGLPVVEALRRTRSTGTQTKLTAQERRANLENALRPTKSFQPGRPCILIDDVTTTGSTLSACAAVLLKAGAGDVQALTCAWAPAS